MGTCTSKNQQTAIVDLRRATTTTSQLTKDDSTSTSTTSETTTTSETMTMMTVEKQQQHLPSQLLFPKSKSYRQWLSKVKEDPWLLEDAPHYIRNKRQIVEEAIQKDGDTYQFISPSLRKDPHLALIAVQNWGGALQFISPTIISEEIVIAACTNYGFALKYAPPQWKNNLEVVLQIVCKRGNALKYVSPRLQNNKRVVKLSVQQDGSSLGYASPQLQNDREIAILAIKNQNPLVAMKYVGEFIKRDPEIIAAAAAAAAEAAFSGGALADDDGSPPTTTKAKNNAESLKLRQRQQQQPQQQSIQPNQRRAAVTNNTTTSSRLIVLSTTTTTTRQQRSSHHYEDDSGGASNNFVPLFLSSEYIQKEEGDFVFYLPDNSTTKASSPRGDNDDDNWTIKFTNQLQESKATGGFMIQLISSKSPIDDDDQEEAAKLELDDDIQQMELSIAQSVGVKVFHVYKPTSYVGNNTYHEAPRFLKTHVNYVTTQISQWYNDNDNEDDENMSVTTTIRQPY